MKSITIDLKNEEFQKALQLIQFTKQSVFLTGKAGTGKSTFLKYICTNTKKKHIVLAPTGIAAINAGGNTLHSFFKLPFYPLLPNNPNLETKGGRIHEFFKYTKQHRKILKEVELVIIDEISMVRADTIDAIDRILRIYSHNLREPFGGKQLLLVGDIFQLEPVVKSDDREIISKVYSSPFFFDAIVFKQIELISIELQRVYRQTDPLFVKVLNKIRTDEATPTDLKLINTRVQSTPSADELYITLATKRDNVDYINNKKLEELKSTPLTFIGKIDGEFPENSLPTAKELTLKVGAQVIFVKNDFDKRWVNGTLGIVTDIDEDGSLYIETEDGENHLVTVESWQNIKYSYDDEKKTIVEEILGSFTQYPIKLAWAITIHKSQGLTFNRVIIDFGQRTFSGGQAYVALSRCTSLQGMILKRPVTPSDIFIRKEVLEFATAFNNESAINKAMQEAQADLYYQASIKAFDAGNFSETLNNLFSAIHLRYDLEKPLYKRFTEKKLSIINTLKQENEMLRGQLEIQTKELKKYAKEYYIMGNSCITEAKDKKAALANYNKALSLDPTFVDAWVRKGVTLSDLKRFEEAETSLNKAVLLNPNLFKTVYNRGRVRLLTKKYEEAVADLDKATTFKPDHSKAHRLFGDALHAIGKKEEAEVHWRIAKDLRKK